MMKSHSDREFSWYEEHRVILEGCECLQSGDALGARLALERYLDEGGLCTEAILVNLLNAYLDAPPDPWILDAFVDDVLDYVNRYPQGNSVLAGNLSLLLLRMKRFRNATDLFEGLMDSGTELFPEEQADYLFAALNSGEPALCHRAADYLEWEVLPGESDPDLIRELIIALASLREASGSASWNLSAEMAILDDFPEFQEV